MPINSTNERVIPNKRPKSILLYNKDPPACTQSHSSRSSEHFRGLPNIDMLGIRLLSENHRRHLLLNLNDNLVEQTYRPSSNPFLGEYLA